MTERETRGATQCPMISFPSPSQWHCLKKIDHFDPIDHAGAHHSTTQACTNTRTTPWHATEYTCPRLKRWPLYVYDACCWLPRFERGKERKTSAWQPPRCCHAPPATETCCWSLSTGAAERPRGRLPAALDAHQQPAAWLGDLVHRPWKNILLLGSASVDLPAARSAA